MAVAVAINLVFGRPILSYQLVGTQLSSRSFSCTSERVVGSLLVNSGRTAPEAHPFALPTCLVLPLPLLLLVVVLVLVAVKHTHLGGVWVGAEGQLR